MHHSLRQLIKCTFAFLFLLQETFYIYTGIYNNPKCATLTSNIVYNLCLNLPSLVSVIFADVSLSSLVFPGN